MQPMCSRNYAGTVGREKFVLQLASAGLPAVFCCCLDWNTRRLLQFLVPLCKPYRQRIAFALECLQQCVCVCVCDSVTV
jgi:hypothetical protein